MYLEKYFETFLSPLHILNWYDRNKKKISSVRNFLIRFNEATLCLKSIEKNLWHVSHSTKLETTFKVMDANVRIHLSIEVPVDSKTF